MLQSEKRIFFGGGRMFLRYLAVFSHHDFLCRRHPPQEKGRDAHLAMRPTILPDGGRDTEQWSQDLYLRPLQQWQTFLSQVFSRLRVYSAYPCHGSRWRRG